MRIDVSDMLSRKSYTPKDPPKGKRTFTVSEVLGIVTGVVGLLSVALFRDGLINALGGYTSAQYAAAGSKSVAKAPYYKFWTYQNLHRKDCVEGLEKAAERLGGKRVPWSSNLSETAKYGVTISLSEGEERAELDLACFYRKITSAQDDYMTLVLFSINTPKKPEHLVNDQISESAKEAFDAAIPNSVNTGIPTPFEPYLDEYGRYVLRETYRGREIMLPASISQHLDSPKMSLSDFADNLYAEKADPTEGTDDDVVKPVVVPVRERPDDPTAFEN